MTSPFLKLTSPTGKPVFVHVDDVSMIVSTEKTRMDDDGNRIGEPFAATDIIIDSGVATDVSESAEAVHEQWLSVSETLRDECEAEFSDGFSDLN